MIKKLLLAIITAVAGAVLVLLGWSWWANKAGGPPYMRGDDDN